MCLTQDAGMQTLVAKKNISLPAQETRAQHKHYTA